MEKPILFSGEMVRAILEGWKIQTRRILKPQPTNENIAIIDRKLADDSDLYMTWLNNSDGGIDQDFNAEYWKCPYGKEKDLLWVRETFAIIDNREFGGKRYPQYRADRPNDPYPGDWPEEEAKGNPDAPKWKPSIFMPKKYARIWLEITNVRVEKLQDIKMKDCAAEGVEDFLHGGYDFNTQNDGSCLRHNFHRLWDSINGKKHPWSSNPWVWVVAFKGIEK